MLVCSSLSEVTGKTHMLSRHPRLRDCIMLLCATPQICSIICFAASALGVSTYSMFSAKAERMLA